MQYYLLSPCTLLILSKYDALIFYLFTCALLLLYSPLKKYTKVHLLASAEPGSNSRRASLRTSVYFKLANCAETSLLTRIPVLYCPNIIGIFRVTRTHSRSNVAVVPTVSALEGLHSIVKKESKHK